MEQKNERNAFAVLDVIGELTAAVSGAGDNNQATRDMARWLLWRITTGWTEGKPEMRGVDEAIRTAAATALAAYFDGIIFDALAQVAEPTAFPGPPATSFSRWRNPKTEARGAPFDEPTNGVIGADVKPAEDCGGFEVGDEVEWRDGRGAVWSAVVISTADDAVTSTIGRSDVRRTFRRDVDGAWRSGIMTLHMRRPAGIPAPTPHEVEVAALKAMVAEMKSRLDMVSGLHSAAMVGLRKKITEIEEAKKDREHLPDISKDALKLTW